MDIKKFKHLKNTRKWELWNGKIFSKSIVKKTGLNQKIIKIEFSNGRAIECTEYHHFFIKDNNNNQIKVEAKNLKIQDEIISFKFPERHLMNNNIQIINNMNDILNKYGLFKNNNFYLESDNNNLYDILNILNCIGIYGKINIHNKNITFNYQELIILKDICHNKELHKGFDLTLEKNKENTQIEPITIVSIKDEDKIEDTYCFHEPEEHVGIFNGILAGNCIEILEYSDDKEYAVCTLGISCLT